MVADPVVIIIIIVIILNPHTIQLWRIRSQKVKYSIYMACCFLIWDSCCSYMLKCEMMMMITITPQPSHYCTILHLISSVVWVWFEEGRLLTDIFLLTGGDGIFWEEIWDMCERGIVVWSYNLVYYTISREEAGVRSSLLFTTNNNTH